MLKKIFLFFILSFLLLVFPRHSLAAGEFATDVTVNYKIEKGGTTFVSHLISLENLFSDLYATSYSLVLDNIEPKNISVFEGSKALPFKLSKEGAKNSLTIDFPEALVGKGEKRIFTVLFEEAGFAARTGEVWEISIPRLSSDENFRSYNVSFSVPATFGTEAYISPKPKEVKTEEGRVIYFFEKEDVERTGVTAGFGAFQVFSFTLNYHLENPLSKSAKVDIALPPDTALQRVYYQVVNPKPENIYVDSDGNWLATFVLKSRERIDVEVKGIVQIFAAPRSFPGTREETLQENLKEREFWETSNPKIKELAEKLKTPAAIYDYVWQTLSYDYERVRPNVERFGAVKALENPTNAICMEFTDLFIALARSAGIPAREINGYAYTENPEIQPLSLVADVLHAWPEYWDESKKAWIPIDPTWASTTGGVDFFSKLDLRHFTFVIHGKDPQKPYPPGSYKLGPNPQKDVFVSFGTLPEERVSHPEITVVTKRPVPFGPTRLDITIRNPGPVALYNLAPAVSFNGSNTKTEIIEVLLPYAHYEIESAVPYSFLGRSTPETVTVLVADSQVQVPTNKNQIILESAIVLLLLLLILVLVILIRFKKIQISKFRDKIRVLVGRITKKDNPPLS
ncbi:MAG: Transglutaminase-like protein [Candidatus Woesebacteria bacterium GW2011_GWF2_46_8]|uniref:Transglutaminase-like protein n=1 Tax=Candidatus Woesebacteria bacterium GW2011_GWF2_46_8 TaxID=1618604 RepID=A0A0G1QRM1_9BACT|nr:MAG: Transglutaminase-like protein [Candidatus Woesebacteria bacterium GW2011_GWF2_46_8]